MRDGHWNAGVTTTAGAVFGIVATVLISTTTVNRGALNWGDWLQFIGTLIGAAATIGAGIAAWMTIQGQMAAPENRAVEIIFRFAVSTQYAATMCHAAAERAIADRFEVRFDSDTVEIPAGGVKIDDILKNFDATVLNEAELLKAKEHVAPSIISKTQQVEATIAELRSNFKGPMVHYREILSCADKVRREADSLMDAIREWEAGI